jgi:response regulator RpfG family c-di-GMP phosphodiesterase
MRDHHAEVDRLRSLAARLAEGAGLDPGERKALDIAASMIGVKRLHLQDIMDKRGPLTPEDRARMKEVTSLWADFAGQIDVLRELGVARILESYTEHWDGSGHPAGLAGEAIPAAARVLSVCFHYNGMVSDRAYRPALSAARARHELTRMSGTVLDPGLVELLGKALEVERRQKRSRAGKRKRKKRTG